MLLTVIPLALNILSGAAVWTGHIPLPAKIVITVILCAKLGMYFYTAVMEPTPRAKSFGLLGCAAVNALLVVFFIWKSLWMAIPGCGILAVLAVVWGSVSGFSFRKED